MEIFTVEFWVAFQLLVDLFLVILILHSFKKIRAQVDQDVSKEAAEQVITMIEPLLKEANKTAKAFEAQLKEKNKLIKDLNESLDKRIISLNLLLSRADKSPSTADPPNNTTPKRHIYDQQESILELYKKGNDIETISRKLSLPRGEVELVIDLKKKFLDFDKIK